jgi:hypothetical protein
MKGKAADQVFMSAAAHILCFLKQLGNLLTGSC